MRKFLLQFRPFITFGLTTYILLIITHTIHAQTDQVAQTAKVDRINMVSGNLGLMWPQNNFAKYIQHPKFQLSASYFYQPKPNKPSFVGLELCLAQLERAEADVINGANQEANASTSTSMAGLRFSYRYYPPTHISILEPFLEGSLGIHWLFAYTTISEFDSEESDFTFDKNDLVLFYGVAAGFNIPVGSSDYIQVRCGYYPGLSANYYTKDDSNPIPVLSSIEAFTIRKSSTDVLCVDAGYTYVF